MRRSTGSCRCHVIVGTPAKVLLNLVRRRRGSKSSSLVAAPPQRPIRPYRFKRSLELGWLANIYRHVQRIGCAGCLANQVRNQSNISWAEKYNNKNLPNTSTLYLGLLDDPLACSRIAASNCHGHAQPRRFHRHGSADPARAACHKEG